MVILLSPQFEGLNVVRMVENGKRSAKKGLGLWVKRGITQGLPQAKCSILLCVTIQVG